MLAAPGGQDNRYITASGRDLGRDRPTPAGPWQGRGNERSRPRSTTSGPGPRESRQGTVRGSRAGGRPRVHRPPGTHRMRPAAGSDPPPSERAARRSGHALGRDRESRAHAHRPITHRHHADAATDGDASVEHVARTYKLSRTSGPLAAHRRDFDGAHVPLEAGASTGSVRRVDADRRPAQARLHGCGLTVLDEPSMMRKGLGPCRCIDAPAWPQVPEDRSCQRSVMCIH